MFESLTAQGLLDALGNGSMEILLINLVAFLAGLAANIYNKMKANGITFKQYWSEHLFNSSMSIVTLVSTFCSMAFLSPTAPIYAYFAVAFTGDSLVNFSSSTEDRNVLVDGSRKQKTVAIAVLFVLFVVICSIF